jgi:integrase
VNSARAYEEDVKDFFVAVKDTSAPKTVSISITAVKAFFISNKVELSQTFWKILKTKTSNRAISQEIVPSKEQIRQILTHLDSKGRALYLMLVSSGMRINEALELTLDDIDFETVPTKIFIRSQITKGGNKRITFISNEATEALKE